MNQRRIWSPGQPDPARVGAGDVWAPAATAVDLVLDGGARHRLHRADDGWHRLAAGDGDAAIVLGHGDRYAFCLDGGEPLPDPRSAWQPEGVDGRSAVDDPTRFAWTDAGWRGFHLPGAVLYELHVGTFSPAGTFDGAIERLDHLVDLGVDAVELLPVAEFMGERGWGYDGVALWAPHHAYGGPDGLRRLVDACHGRGLGVVLDVVYNHLGPRGNHLFRFGPYLHDAETPWGQAVNLDGPGSHEVRRFVLDNARHWFVDHHVDGLRLDATHALVDDSPVHVLAELSAATEALAASLRRPLCLIAEREQEELLPVRARECGGWGLHARWADDLHHAIHAALTGERDGYYAPFGRLADIATAVTRGCVPPGESDPAISGHRAVVATQNHDQVGNRAGGERLVDLAGPEAAMAAAAIVLAAPATVLLFQGEEWAASSPFPFFCDPPDDELAAAVTEGRREEFAAFGWEPDDVPDPVDPATAGRAVLRWDELGRQPHARMLAWYRTLLRLRRERPDLTDGRRSTVAVDVDEAHRTLVVRRRRTAVVVNLADEPRRVDLATPVLGVLATSGEAPAMGPDGGVTVATRTTVVLAVERGIVG